MTDFLVGTGGWSYFNIQNTPSLKAYSRVFNFVEVNQTFYEYPEVRRVEGWRRMVPENFIFSVRCHQDLTHRIGLKPVDEAFSVLGRMVSYCDMLETPLLVMETPANYTLTTQDIDQAKQFLSSSTLKGVRLVWEIRSSITRALINLMQDFNIVHCVDLSIEKPSVNSDLVYSRLFGKGWHNIYQFTDEELIEIDTNAQGDSHRLVALSYHGVRMNTDAARFLQYKKTGKFMPVTSFTGVDSAKAVLSEDSQFPSSKSKLIEHQGWKVVDVTSEKRVHLSELLSTIPEKTYKNVNEVVEALEMVV